MIKILSLALVLILFSCKNDKKEKQLPQNKTELIDKEEKQIELNSEVENNIIHCENKKYIIKIDNLKNGDLRYASWNKPNSINDKPNLVIYKGKVERRGTAGGYDYMFKNGEWEYLIDHTLIAETPELTGFFLKLLKNGEQKYYSKMDDLTIKK